MSHTTYLSCSDTMLEPLDLTGPPDGIRATSCQASDAPFELGGDHNGFMRIFSECNLHPDGIVEGVTRHVLTIGGDGSRLF